MGEVNAESHGEKETTAVFQREMDSARPKLGRPRLSDDFLRGVAAAYTEAARSGDSAPSLAAWEWGKANGHPEATTEEAGRGWVYRARNRTDPQTGVKFLPPGEAGKVTIEEERQ